jgi:methyl-accepting chemotaxis protein
VERTKKSIYCLAAGIATVASLLLGLWIVSDSPRPSSRVSQPSLQQVAAVGQVVEAMTEIQRGATETATGIAQTNRMIAHLNGVAQTLRAIVSMLLLNKSYGSVHRDLKVLHAERSLG